MSTDPFMLDRQRMLNEQLARRGIREPVLTVMGRVPRDRFVPAHYRADAYADCALPIDCGQTISQPYIVALMTEALELTGRERVLEIGTGSGYQTAVLAELAECVVSIERHADLSAEAGRVLRDLGYTNVTLLIGDGTQGCASRAPYDRVLVAAAAHDYPRPLFEQLSEGGLLVIPIGGSHSQILQAIRKRNGEPLVVDLTTCRFVPLVAERG